MNPVGSKVREFIPGTKGSSSYYKNGGLDNWVCIKAEQPDYEVGIKKNGKAGAVGWKDPTRWVCTLLNPTNNRHTIVTILHYPHDFKVFRFKLKPPVKSKKPVFKRG